MRLLLGVLMAVPAVGLTQEINRCGSLENAYGPYDYTNADHRRNRLPIVEGAHLTRQVLSLKRGETAHRPGGDLDYTLRAFPNHHRALHAAARYQLMNGGKLDMRYTIECYFDRASRFQPRDAVVPMLHAIYLDKKGQPEAALAKYQESLRLNPDSAEGNYNIGLLLAKMGRYQEAKVHADKAYEMGFPLPGLRNILAEHIESDDGNQDQDDN